MCITHSLHVYYTFNACVLHIHCMCITHSLHVYCAIVTRILCIHCLCIANMYFTLITCVLLGCVLDSIIHQTQHIKLN